MFSCQICKSKFETHQILYSHLIMHKNCWGCMKCDHIANSGKARRNHLKVHQPVTCATCNLQFEKVQLHEHRKSHEYLYSIDQLNGIVDIIDQIQGNGPTNKTDKPRTEKYYSGKQLICPVKNCDKKFQIQNDLIHHFIVHRRNHSCEFCHEIFSNLQKYQEHFTQKKCRLYTCFSCDKEFSLEKFVNHIMTECSEILLKHEDEVVEIEDDVKDVEIIEIVEEPIENPPIKQTIYRIHDDNRLSFRCYLCEEELSKIGLLHKHLQTQHHSYISNICPKCYCVFEHDYELLSHQTFDCKPDNLDKQTLNKIKNCFDDYIQRTSYLQTNARVYEMLGDAVIFPCPVCYSKFVQYDYLVEHCDISDHDLIVCYGCCFIFETWKERRQHFCVKTTDAVINKLKFHKLFPKNRNPIVFETTLSKNIYDKDIITRMNKVVKKLEKVKFPNRKQPKYYNFTPCTIPANSTSDEFDFNKIVTRVMELRRNPVCKEEIQEMGDHLNHLTICKIEKNETNIIVSRLKRNNEDDETIENISKFLEEFDGPPPKKFKQDENNPINDKFETDSSDDEIPNKIRKY